MTPSSAKTWRAVAIYCRVSTAEQSVDQQVDALTRWVAPRAQRLEVFSEAQSSRRERPAQQEMLRRARAGDFNAIVVWKFDRFARTARELVMWLDEAKGLGIDFLSFTESLDTSTPIGQAMFTILAAIAELERSLVAERTRAKLDLLRSRGVRLGRPRALFDMDRARRLVLEHHLTVRKLARALGVSSGTAHKVIRQIREEAAVAQSAQDAAPDP